MGGKGLTLIVLSPRRGKLRQFRISGGWFVCGVLFVVLSLVVGAYGFSRHWATVQQRRLMTSLLEDRSERQQQFLRIGSEVEELSQQLVRLQKLDKKIRIITNLDDSALAVQFSGMGGVNPEEGIVEDLRREQEQRWAERIRQHLRGLRDLGDQQEASFRYLEQALEEKRDLLACTPSIWPTQGWLSCGFGHRQSPFTGLREFHRGVDVATRRGTPVMAPADGVMIETGKDAGFGLFLRLDHGFSYKTFYAHLHEIVVKKGQKVRRGQMIARVGNTGRSTGPHLHYEIHVSGLPVNPIRYILD